MKLIYLAQSDNCGAQKKYVSHHHSFEFLVLCVCMRESEREREREMYWGWTHGMCYFLYHGLNQHYSSNPSHCSDNAWSLIQGTTKKLSKLVLFLKKLIKITKTKLRNRPMSKVGSNRNVGTIWGIKEESSDPFPEFEGILRHYILFRNFIMTSIPDTWWIFSMQKSG